MEERKKVMDEHRRLDELYNLLAGIIRSLGDSKTPVYFLALSSFLNIFLDFALILWFDTGVAGAAIEN